MQSLYTPGTREHDVIEKVHKLMIELGTLKNRMKLRMKTHFAPIKRNDTRWGSVFLMLKRYLDICNILPSCEFSRSTKTMFLNADDHYVIEELVQNLYKCEKTSKFLQTEDHQKVNLLSTRVAFDILISEIPVLAAYLAPDAAIVHDPVFESAVVKLQMGDEQLSVEEAQAVEVFRTREQSTSSNTASDEPKTFEDEMRLAVEARKATKGQGKTYRSTLYISPTSNIVERLFSRAGIVMSARRKQMDPSTLEMFLMLRVNKHMWSEETLQNIIDKKKSASVGAAIARSKRKQDDEAIPLSDGENSN